jgi:hypothetical protein
MTSAGSTGLSVQVATMSRTGDADNGRRQEQAMPRTGVAEKHKAGNDGTSRT